MITYSVVLFTSPIVWNESHRIIYHGADIETARHTLYNLSLERGTEAQLQCHDGDSTRCIASHSR